MEKFLNISSEKQNNIINSALVSFGKLGYKKASINDIAKNAGVSKGIIFHYFGNKKALYLYLIDFSFDLMMDEINNNFDKNITDFFDKIIVATNIKMDVMKRYPYLLTFFTSIYFESDTEVKDEINQLLLKSEEIRDLIVFDKIDEYKFKDGVDPKLVLNILTKFSEGCVSNPQNDQIDIDKILLEFDECMTLLKNNLYKKEYLK